MARHHPLFARALTPVDAPPDASLSGGASEMTRNAEAVCVACGSRRTGPFCAACGQRARNQRHTLRSLATDALHHLFNVERGLTHTVFRLTVDPGGVVRGYLAGRTVVYVNPVAYLIIAFAVLALTLRLQGGTGGGDERVFAGTIVFFVAAASRVVFLRAGLNYVEHLILNMFLLAHALVLLTSALILASPWPQSIQLVMVALGVVSGCAYVLWGYTRVFASRPVLAALGALLALASGIGLWGSALAIFIRLARG